MDLSEFREHTLKRYKKYKDFKEMILSIGSLEENDINNGRIREAYICIIKKENIIFPGCPKRSKCDEHNTCESCWCCGIMLYEDEKIGYWRV
ncbi:MAG: hypothetical protein ACRC0F_01845 [Cetobacterium sp.]